MQIFARMNGSLAQLAGTPRLSLALPENATVANLLHQLCQQHPALLPKLDIILPVISGRYVALTEPLHDGQEVALLLPVAGG